MMTKHDWQYGKEKKLKEKERKLLLVLQHLIYNIIKGEIRGKIISVLDLEVRYKGTFTPYPQFIGGMSDILLRR